MFNSRIHDVVAHAAHFLPEQGPITSFVHHNTLHAFENLPFERGAEVAAERYGRQPYLSEARYWAELERGRIRPRDLEVELRAELGERGDEMIAGLVRRIDLFSAMLMDPVRLASEAELEWVVAAGDGVRSFRRRCPRLTCEQILADTRQWVMRDLRGERETDAHLRALAADVLSRWGEERIERWSRAAWEEVTLTLLWRLCRAGVGHLESLSREAQPRARLRDAIYRACGEDPDLLVHDVLIRFSAVFADQGLAAWRLPGAGDGYYRCFLALYGAGYPVRERWMRSLPDEIARLVRDGSSAEASIEASLAAFGVKDEERSAFITESLLALSGWAGMLWQLESRPDLVKQPVPPGTLVEFLAVRLILDHMAAMHVARGMLGPQASLADLRHALVRRVLGARREGVLPESRVASGDAHRTPTQRAYMIFQLAQSLGWPPRRLATLSQQQWQALAGAIEAFPALARRRLFHRAYERRFRMHVLDTLSAERSAMPLPSTPSPSSPVRPALQVVCCLDEREGSLRRHLEEVDPAVETFGAAGFFGVAMYYRGAWDAHEMPLCPVSIRPVHRVFERVAAGDRASHARGASWMRRLAFARERVHAGSLGFAGGLVTTLVGALAAVPLVARVLFPRRAARLRHRAGMLMQPAVRTELAIECDPGSGTGTGTGSGDDEAQAGALRDGFLPEEMSAIVSGLLREIGLTKSFAHLVIIIGHGSSSLNNPHEAAHDCGACGGGRGGPNARAFAQMANHPQVRERLVAAGLPIPDDTWFLGAYHNTCDDSITFYDRDRLPPSLETACHQAWEALDRACDRNAHERCRRFRSAGLLIAPQEARRHVESRSEDLAQPRPEFGHATNALCVIGRRARTRGLFMDRRAFLMSYDPAADAEDPSSTILSRVLNSAVPVCAGINLEYYFSYVDPTGWGCGTKLPHNITSLLGVMDGSASDLRPGLPWQMVEIHDAVRLTIVVETTPARLSAILERNASIARLCRNGWVWLATLDPDTPSIHVYEHGAFRAYVAESGDLPVVASSARWYGGLREHLDFAAIHPPEERDRLRSMVP